MKSLQIFLYVHIWFPWDFTLENLHCVMRADVLDSGRDLAFVIIRFGQIGSPYGLAFKGRDNKRWSPLARILGKVSLFVSFMNTGDRNLVG